MVITKPNLGFEPRGPSVTLPPLPPPGTLYRRNGKYRSSYPEKLFVQYSILDNENPLLNAGVIEVPQICMIV